MACMKPHHFQQWSTTPAERPPSPKIGVDLELKPLKLAMLAAQPDLAGEYSASDERRGALATSQGPL
jgi:hypothetical protein